MANAPTLNLTGPERDAFELLCEGVYAPAGRFVATTGASIDDASEPTPGPGPRPCTVALAAASVPTTTVAIGSWLAFADLDGTLLGGLLVKHVNADGATLIVDGDVSVVRKPLHADFPDLRQALNDVRQLMAAVGRPHVVAYQPGWFLHRGTEQGLRVLSERLNASVLLQVLVHYREDLPLTDVARVTAIRASAVELGPRFCRVAVTPMPEGLDAGGARRVRTWLAWRAGATHLAVAAGAGDAAGGLDAWDVSVARELGLAIVPLPAYALGRASNELVDVAADGECSGEVLDQARLESQLAERGTLPEGSVSRGVARALTSAVPPRQARGFTVFFTGLSGAGKSTIARTLRARLMTRTCRDASLLDGDAVRRHLSSELGFSREHRDLNILRIGYVAAEITRHRGIAICAPIAPYDAMRKQIRRMIEPHGAFVLVHVATPLDVCEARDTKGLYARARAGLLPQFTGVSDPYEPPDDADVIITGDLSPDAASAAIVRHLERQGLVPPEAGW